VRQPFCLIVNPAAARGHASRQLPAALGVLGAAGAAVEIHQSTSLADAARAAGRAVGRGRTVVAMGGDGMVGALAAAVAAAEGVMGIIPAGRGNDFARMLGVPRRTGDAAAVLLTGQHISVDLVGVRVAERPEVVVAGSVYLGVPSEGGELANRSRWVRGTLGYQVAGLAAVLRWRPATFTLSMDGAPPLAALPGFCVLAANSSYLAAGRHAAPGADLTDGLLDILTVRETPPALAATTEPTQPGAGVAHGSPAPARPARLPVAWKLPFLRVMLAAGRGTHLRFAEVEITRAASVTVIVDRDMPAAADGETLPGASPLPAGSPLRVRILPGALRVIVPAARADGVGAAATEERLHEFGAP
jgi:diacylglycerol kinase (ATP)